MKFVKQNWQWMLGLLAAGVALMFPGAYLAAMMTNLSGAFSVLGAAAAPTAAMSIATAVGAAVWGIAFAAQFTLTSLFSSSTKKTDPNPSVAPSTSPVVNDTDEKKENTSTYQNLNDKGLTLKAPTPEPVVAPTKAPTPEARVATPVADAKVAVDAAAANASEIEAAESNTVTAPSA